MNSLLKVSPSINIHHCFCKKKEDKTALKLTTETQTLTRHYNI